MSCLFQKLEWFFETYIIIIIIITLFEHLAFKLILMQWTNLNDIIFNMIICGYRNSLQTTRSAIKQVKLMYKSKILYLECPWKPHKSIVFSNAGYECHRASWGSVVQCKARDCKRITITAVSNELPPGHLLHSFSCKSSLVWYHK